MKPSIITINRNNATGLKKTIESVLSQTYSEMDDIKDKHRYCSLQTNI